MTEHRPRVLHVIASLQRGGTETQLVQFIRRSSNPELHQVVLFDEPNPLSDLLPVPPVLLGKMSRELRGAPGNLRVLRRLRREILRHRADVVHAHLGLSEVLAATVVPPSTPVISSRRGRNVGLVEHRHLKMVEGLCHRRVDVMICNSAYLAEYARTHDLWVPPTEVVYNGVDLQTFRVTPTPTEGPPTVTMVANLIGYKRHEDFLRALRRVVDEIPQVRGILVGDGPERDRLSDVVSTLGLESNVTFAGQVADPREIVASAHIVCLTSAHEGFPNALIEAMAMGRPVVATRVGGIPELVRDGTDGLLTSSDPAEIARAMLRLLDDPELRASMGVNAHERAEEFGWDRVVRETEAVYERVLTDRRGRRPALPFLQRAGGPR